MRWKSLAGVVAMATGALVIGALLGQPGSGHATTPTTLTASTSPTITGTPQEGETLTAHAGTWSATPDSYTYTWQRCDTNGDNCSTIGSPTNATATTTTYTLVAPDVGTTLRIEVTAHTSSDTGTATSVPTAIVSSAAAPSNTAVPTISGSIAVGSTLTGTKGTWSGNVNTYTYAWERCDTQGNSCSPISGATSTTYTLTTADIGTTLRFAVTATNGAGSTTATSVPTTSLPRPADTGCPSGTGTIQAADLAPPARLTVSQWSISPSVTYSTNSIQLYVQVTACNGRPVQGVTVFAVPIPYNQFQGKTGTTGSNGGITLVEPRQTGFPATQHQQLLAVLIRASQPGKSVIAGVSTRRIVSFRVSH